MIEIERKFLVSKLPENLTVLDAVEINQGYLNDGEVVTRVRTASNTGYITIKVPLGDGKLGCNEYEYQIPVQDAINILKVCNHGRLHKIRYIVQYRNTVYDVDVFKGNLEGLILAEVELEHEDQEFDRPDWLGKEVTGDKRYYNKYLATHRN